MVDSVNKIITMAIAVAAVLGAPGLSKSASAEEDWTEFYGGGVDWRIDERFSVRGEYMYGNYGSESLAIVSTPDSVEFETHIMREGLVWNL
ncbi:MAG: hypothetical protein JKY27_03055 [Magnetovibrio sp.]|nr:hypothetical protein [Magnetovibrio sp.]